MIVQYLADQKPDSGLAPTAGTSIAIACRNGSTSSPPSCTRPSARSSGRRRPTNSRRLSKENLGKRFDWLDKQLAGKQYLMGDKFTVADAYLFTVLHWTPRIEIDLAKWPNLKAYVDRVAARPKVQEAMKAEGLVQ